MNTNIKRYLTKMETWTLSRFY